MRFLQVYAKMLNKINRVGGTVLLKAKAVSEFVKSVKHFESSFVK